MIYVMSDLHGCFDLYKKMLDKIQLKEEDVLYILGDIVDRGDKPIEILLDIAERKNIIALCGNHDYDAKGILKKYASKPTKDSSKFKEVFNLWLSDGGITTFEGFMRLSYDDREKVIKVLDSQAIFEELQLGEQKFFLAHSVPEKELFENFDSLEIHDFIMGEPDYELVYDDDLIIITGHTPTSFIDEKYRGRIWRNNNHIAIDCGAVFHGTLGCLCLDTMEEIYVYN